MERLLCATAECVLLISRWLGSPVTVQFHSEATSCPHTHHGRRQSNSIQFLCIFFHQGFLSSGYIVFESTAGRTRRGSGGDRRPPLRAPRTRTVYLFMRRSESETNIGSRSAPARGLSNQTYFFSNLFSPSRIYVLTLMKLSAEQIGCVLSVFGGLVVVSGAINHPWAALRVRILVFGYRWV